MAVVELHVHDPVLPELDGLLVLLDGTETGRRRSQYVDDVTIVDVAMKDAPRQAAVMEVVLQRVGEEVQVLNLAYFDECGRAIEAIASQDVP
jgi:hypothetical protein